MFKFSLSVIIVFLIANSFLTLFSCAAEAPCKTDSSCGISPHDWCCAPKGDPCGSYNDKKSCQSDSMCEGLPYLGESAVPCQWDERGFSSNCPTVGCVSRCENLNAQDCLLTKGRCVPTDQGCAELK